MPTQLQFQIPDFVVEFKGGGYKQFKYCSVADLREAAARRAATWRIESFSLALALAEHFDIPEDARVIDWKTFTEGKPAPRELRFGSYVFSLEKDER
jgi:hypothetical protein